MGVLDCNTCETAFAGFGLQHLPQPPKTQWQRSSWDGYFSFVPTTPAAEGASAELGARREQRVGNVQLKGVWGCRQTDLKGKTSTWRREGPWSEENRRGGS